MSTRSTPSLSGKTIAVLVDDGFEQVELFEPRQALEGAGARVHVVSPKSGRVKGWDETEWGEEVKVDVPLAKAAVDDYDALVLPGGVMNPDTLRADKAAVALVAAFFAAGKPVAAICHGPWTVLEAGAAKGRTMTSWPSLRTDLENAGATWVDKEVVVDGQLVTSRKPADLAAFSRETIALVAGGAKGG